jgi:hypothetical protein
MPARSAFPEHSAWVVMSVKVRRNAWAEAECSPGRRSGDSVRRSVRVVQRDPGTWTTFIGVACLTAIVNPVIHHAVGCMSSMRLPNGSVT